MMLWETFLLAQRAIRRNKLRSALTILGIVIGVAAVICMVTLGSGATQKVTSDISKLGSNVLHVRRGQGMQGPGGARSASDPLSIEDATAIRNNIAGLQAVAPVAEGAGQAIYRSKNWSTSITGGTNDYLIVESWELEAGRKFNDNEQKAGKAVCLIGQTVRKEVFGEEPPLGKTMRLGKIAFKVIGTLKEKGQSGFGNDQDDIAIIPLRTLQRRIAGNDDVRTILVAVNAGISTNTVKTELESLMRERRGIRQGQEDDFYVRDMKEIIDTVTGTTTVLTALLSAVAGVSLLVGGIGIMNIMLVSVTERTREIGTRLAIGAFEKDVLMQFLVESVTLSTLGGIVGIFLGLGSAALISRFIGVPFVLKPGIIVAAFFFSGAVGIIFGYVPAKKAAQLDPIEALRYE